MTVIKTVHPSMHASCLGVCSCMDLCMCLHVSVHMCSAGPEAAILDWYSSQKQNQDIG